MRFDRKKNRHTDIIFRLPRALVLISFRILFFSILSASLAWAQAPKTLEDVGRGIPVFSDIALPNTALVPFKASKLKDARVVWVNWELLEEMGVQFPQEGLTPEFERQILNEFAYTAMKNQKNESGESKTFYADRYGGIGTGYALGSGRAGSVGKFQVKGIGRTPLAPSRKSVNLFPQLFMPSVIGAFVGFTTQNPWYGLLGFTAPLLYNGPKLISEYTHSHGGASLRESLMEAIWGELVNKETPYGATRTAFVIDTGTNTEWIVAKDPRGLNVRENPLRPANFMENFNYNDPTLKNTFPSLEELFRQLTSSELSEKSAGRLVNEGLIEITKRIGRQYGALYSRSIYHGAEGPANTQINGKSLDFGTMTTLYGHPRVHFLNWTPPTDYNGGIKNMFKEIILSLQENLQTLCPPNLQNKIPGESSLFQTLDQSFNQEVRRQFLWLLGAPLETLDGLVQNPSAEKFANLLLKVVSAGNDKRVNSRYWIPRKAGRYNFEDIAGRLAKYMVNQSDESQLDEALSDFSSLQELKKASVGFYDALKQSLTKEGISPEGTAKYVILAVATRNKPRTSLMRGPSLWTRIYQKIMAYKWTGKREVISDFIDQNIHESARDSSPYRSPFSIVLQESVVEGTHIPILREYKGKEGDIRTTVFFKNASDANRFFSEGQLTLDVNGKQSKPLNVEHVDNSVRFEFEDVHSLKQNKINLSAPHLPACSDFLKAI